MGFVIGLFFISTLVTAVSAQMENIIFAEPETEEISVPCYDENDYEDTAAQLTADNLTEALNELLLNEGIQADDIRLTLKISEERRITVSRVIIYISKDYQSRETDIENIIYRNIAKEPELCYRGKSSANG